MKNLRLVLDEAQTKTLLLMVHAASELTWYQKRASIASGPDTVCCLGASAAFENISV